MFMGMRRFRDEGEERRDRVEIAIRRAAFKNRPMTTPSGMR